MAANPFDDDTIQHAVLVNEEGQHSLWPAFIDKPSGWTLVYGPSTRKSCLDYVEEHWTDLRPQSLIREMGG